MTAQPTLQNRKHPEAWAGLLLAESVSGKSLTPNAAKYADWLKADFGWWREADNAAGSWNWFTVEGCSLLWLDPAAHAPDTPALTITAWWWAWLALQVGDRTADLADPFIPKRTRTEAHPLSRMFDGTETLSSVYGAGRYGSVAYVRLWALRERKRAESEAAEVKAGKRRPEDAKAENPDVSELLRLTERYLEILSTLLALSSRPWTGPGYKARNGNWWYRGPTWAPVGERSESAGLQVDQGCILEVLRGGPQTRIKARRGWPAEAFAALAATGVSNLPLVTFATSPSVDVGPFDFSSVLANLAGVRLRSETHWTRWAEGLLVWKPRRLNPLTKSIFWAWLDDTKQVMTLGCPFPSVGRDRGKKASGSQGSCELRRNANGEWRILATGIDGGADASLVLPVSGDPVWSIVGDPQSFRGEKLS